MFVAEQKYSLGRGSLIVFLPKGDEVSREILRICKSPRPTEEIMVSVWRYFRDVKKMIELYKTEQD